MGVPRRVRKLYQIRKPSRNFETAFNQFYDDVRHEGIVEDLRGAELEEFLDFLDEVKCSLHHQVIVLTVPSGATT